MTKPQRRTARPSELEEILARFVRANPYGMRDRKDEGRAFQTMQEFVLRNGRSVRPTQLTRAEREYVRACVERVPDLRAAECFSNSQRVFLYGDIEQRFTYAEGYALTVDEVLHGWLMLDGKVVDVSEPLKAELARSRGLPEWTSPREYFGVEFPDRSYVAKKGGLASLIDDWKRGWPLLCGEQWTTP